MKFNEWTSGGHLRQPIFLGLRDDKDPSTVVRERTAVGGKRSASGRARRIPEGASASMKKSAAGTKRASALRSSPSAVIDQLRANPKATNLTLILDSKTKLAVSNLGKVFFPVPKVSKGRLLEFYAEVSSYWLPALADRPLVLKRYPNGIKPEAFYQQKAPDKVPPGIRVESVADDGRPRRCWRGPRDAAGHRAARRGIDGSGIRDEDDRGRRLLHLRPRSGPKSISSA